MREGENNDIHFNQLRSESNSLNDYLQIYHPVQVGNATQSHKDEETKSSGLISATSGSQ